MNFSVTRNGIELDPSKYSWNEETRTFSTNENDLVLDFSDLDECTFKTGSFCSFVTGADCTFDTGTDCIFKTGSFCSFDTGADCTFKAGARCTFDTGYNCTFKTGSYCTFDTRSGCTFNAGAGCTFKTGWNCTFKTGSDCIFKTGEDSVIVRRDIFEVYQTKPNEGFNFKLNGHNVSGYTEIEEVPEEVEMTVEDIQKLVGKKVKIVESK